MVVSRMKFKLNNGEVADYKSKWVKMSQETVQRIADLSAQILPAGGDIGPQHQTLAARHGVSV